MIDPDQKLARAKDAVRGGIVIGQPENPYLALSEALRMRVAMDITANTLLAEARHMLMRAAMLYSNDSGEWVDQAGNLDLSNRLNTALAVLDGNLDGQKLAEIAASE